VFSLLCKAISVQACYRFIGFLEAEAPRLVDSRREKVVKLSALGNRHVNPPGILLVFIYARG